MYEPKGYSKDERQYKTDKDKEKSEFLPKIEDDLYEMKKQKTIKIVDHMAMPRMVDEEIQALNLVSSNVIGNIFDRAKFLEQRITELNVNIEIRSKLHDSIVKEIEKDIDDKNAMIIALSDVNERRNLKLDISVLRKEKRHEDVQFWKDVMELKTELKQLTENYETERKIAAIFNDGEKNESE
ncbi:MAG: hypothetical protein NT120_05290 [Candidatus Aenigmarchaeota archaeon]|nr:hypothetical protein [Candidatus Aenigmarchaeota archaeon]